MKTNDYKAVEDKLKPVNEKKMEKYTNSILRYCKIDIPIDFRELCIMMIEKARENQIKYASPMVITLTLIIISNNVFIRKPPLITFRKYPSSQIIQIYQFFTLLLSNAELKSISL